MSLHQSKWDETVSHDNPITLTLRFLNSGTKVITLASSVVHTGVKSDGWEKRIPHLKWNTTSIKILIFTKTCYLILKVTIFNSDITIPLLSYFWGMFGQFSRKSNQKPSNKNSSYTIYFYKLKLTILQANHEILYRLL